MGIKMEKKVISNQSIDKMLTIIEDMAKYERCRLQDIAKRVNLPASTVLRMVNTLCRRGYAAQDQQTYMYYLTLKFVQLGQAVGGKNHLYEITHSELQKLAESCSESCSVGIEQNGEVVYVDVADRPDGVLKITQRIGIIAPMHTTGIGKMLLLNDSEAQIRNRYPRGELPQLTPNSIRHVDDLLKELDRVRELGYALDDEECELGVRCVAMGIRDSLGKIIAGMSVSGPVQRMTESRILSHRSALAQTIAAVERKL